MMTNYVRRTVRRWIVLLASTVFLFGTVAPIAQAITRNKAEGLANAQTEKDCLGRFPLLNLWLCIHTDLSECTYHSIDPVEWFCTDIYIQRHWLFKSRERVCHTVLGYSINGKLVSKDKIICRPIDPHTA